MPAAVMQLISSLGVGGAERLLIDYVRATAASPRRQVVVVMNSGESPDFRRELEAAGGPVRFLGRTPGAVTPDALGRLLALAREHDVGVVHSHNPGSMLWSCMMKTAAPSLKLAHTLHGEGAVDTLRGPRRLLHRALVAGTVAVSPSIAASAAEAGLSRVTCIENGVDLSRFQSATTGVDGALRIVCVGRLTPDKGQDILLEALALCRTAGATLTARLVGDVAPEHRLYLATLEARIARLGLREIVAIEHGRTDVADILTASDLFVLPSRREGFGLALVEAMASGLPVIAADVGGPGRLLRDHPGAGRLFEAGSAEALAAAIFDLAHNAPLLRRMALAGPAAAAAYSINRMAERYEAFYSTL